MKFFRIFFIFLVCFCHCATSGVLKAIVNDKPISENDLNERKKLLLAQQPMIYMSMDQNELDEKVLQNLIDEKLKLQKGEELNYKVSSNDIENAMLHLERQNGMSLGGLKRILQEQNISEKTLRDQVKSDLIWLQYIRSMSEEISIPKPAVFEKLKNIKLELAKEAFIVSEIFVSNKKTADQLWKNLQSGASFQSLASQYSESASSVLGGYIGRIENDHYGKEILLVLREMPVGQISRPLNYKKGYLILQMLDKKSPITTDEIVVWELAQGAQKGDKIETKIQNSKSCVDFEKNIKKYGIENSFQKGWTDPFQLPNELKDLLNELDLNKVLGPIQIPQGKIFFMKCSTKNQRVVPSFEEAYTQLEAEQAEILSRRLLNTEKRKAVIEIK